MESKHEEFLVEELEQRMEGIIAQLEEIKRLWKRRKREGSRHRTRRRRASSRRRWSKDESNTLLKIDEKPRDMEKETEDDLMDLKVQNSEGIEKPVAHERYNGLERTIGCPVDAVKTEVEKDSDGRSRVATVLMRDAKVDGGREGRNDQANNDRCGGGGSGTMMLDEDDKEAPATATGGEATVSNEGVGTAELQHVLDLGVKSDRDLGFTHSVETVTGGGATAKGGEVTEKEGGVMVRRSDGTGERVRDNEEWGRPPEENAGGATTTGGGVAAEEFVFSMPAVGYGCNTERVENRVRIGGDSRLLDLRGKSLGQAQYLLFTPTQVNTMECVGNNGLKKDEPGCLEWFECGPQF